LPFLDGNHQQQCALKWAKHGAILVVMGNNKSDWRNTVILDPKSSIHLAIFIIILFWKWIEFWSSWSGHFKFLREKGNLPASLIDEDWNE
jgi:hypothetical protein